MLPVGISLPLIQTESDRDQVYVGEHSISTKFLRSRKIYLGMHRKRGENVSTYPRRPKAEAFSNTVDVVERLHDPTYPSTERTAPTCSAHVQHDDVPRAFDPVEDEGDFRQHDGVATVLMMLPPTI